MQDNLKNLPRLRESQNYIGLYVIDFGDHAGVGFTGQEVEELLESEKFKDVKVYKIHNAYADGRVELRGVRSGLFQVEMGMFFYSSNEQEAKGDFKRLVNMAVKTAPPSRAKLHLSRYSDDKYVVTLIYPAECNDEISDWLLASDYKTAGAATGGLSAVQQYYNDKPEILDRHQFIANERFESRSGDELYRYLSLAVQR